MAVTLLVVILAKLLRATQLHYPVLIIIYKVTFIIDLKGAFQNFTSYVAACCGTLY